MNYTKGGVPQRQQRSLVPNSQRTDVYAPSKSPINSKEIVYSEKLGRNEVQELRKKVQEINYNMNKRKRAIVKIQKVWRGYITRKKLRRQKAKLIKEKQERVKLQKKRDTIRRNAPKIICNAIYNYVLKKRNKEKELLRKYLHHCATMIQKTFKGFNTRIKYYRTRRQMKHFQRLLLSVMRGWKTRKIMKHESMAAFQMDIKDIENLQLELAHNDDPDAESIKEEIPFRLSRKKRQFIDSFYRLYFTGSWAQPRYGGGRNQRNGPPQQQRGGGGFRDSRERDKTNDYKPRRGRQNSNEGHPQERRSNRGYERTASIEAYENEGGLLEEKGFNAGEHRDSIPIRGRRDIMPEEEFEAEVGGGYENQQSRRNKEPNAYEARDEMPISGKGAYNLDDLPEEQPGEYKPRVVKKGLKKGKGVKARKESPNAFDAKEEMPVGGKGAYVIPDDEGQANTYHNERDELPITGKGQYVIPEDEGATPGGSGGTSKGKPKRQVAKKAKYDPRKAIEDAKKKEEEEGGDKSTGNKKSEDFRNMLKNARKWQQEDKDGGNQEEKENVSRSNNKPEKKVPVRGRAKGRKAAAQEEAEVAEENDDTTPISRNEEQENEKQDEGGPRKFKFLKRKTKAMANQKLDWNKVSSRIDCWGGEKNEDGTEKSPERPSTSKGKQQPQLSATAHVNPKTGAAAKKGQNQKAVTQKFGRLERQDDHPVNPRKDVKGTGYGQQKRQVSPPKQQQQQHLRSAQHHIIKLEELEKAYNTNFLNKLNHITQKFYSESGARDPEEPYESIVPILRLNSTFFFREDMDRYFDILGELDEEYQSLQIIN